MKKNLLCAALLVVSSAAQATPARMAALSGNAGFADDTDFFRYPSVLGGLAPRAMMTYNGGFDAGVIFDDGQALWFERDTVANDIAAAGPQGGYRALYAKGNGASGYLLRASQAAGLPAGEGDAGSSGVLNLGGAWSSGEGGSNPSNLAISGDLSINGRINDEPTVGIGANITSRNLTQDSMTLWAAGLGYQDDTITLSGGYTAGPRFRNDLSRVALQLGPLGVISINTESETQNLGLTLPISNLAAEYVLRDWIRLRGSATAALFAATTVEDAVDNMAWAAGVGGAFGVGFLHEGARIDMAINPDWVLAGPQFLSGTPNPMFASVTARVDL